jgi:hypothetical protein
LIGQSLSLSISELWTDIVVIVMAPLVPFAPEIAETLACMHEALTEKHMANARALEAYAVYLETEAKAWDTKAKATATDAAEPL